MMTQPERTIAAISTAYGESGIGIVRMSGPSAKTIASRIFVPYSGSNASQNQKPGFIVWTEQDMPGIIRI